MLPVICRSYRRLPPKMALCTIRHLAVHLAACLLQHSVLQQPIGKQLRQPRQAVLLCNLQSGSFGWVTRRLRQQNVSRAGMTWQRYGWHPVAINASAGDHQTGNQSIIVCHICISCRRQSILLRHLTTTSTCIARHLATECILQ